jgi:DHA1 family multidrug resistance protein-like MFS transporter
MFVMNFSRAFPQPVFQEYVELLLEAASRVDTTVGLLGAVMFVVAGFTSVLMGRLADRIGHRALIVAGTVFAGALCIPQAFLTNVWQLLVLRALIGVSAGTIGPAMGRFVHGAIPRTSHGKAFGLVQSANSCSRSLGMLSGGVMNAFLVPWGSSLALRAPFAAAGVFQLLVGLVAWAILRRAGPLARTELERGAPACVAEAEAPGSPAG